QLFIDGQSLDQVEVTNASQGRELKAAADRPETAAVEFRAPQGLRVGDGDVPGHQTGKGNDEGFLLVGNGVEDRPGEERVAGGMGGEGKILVGQRQVKAAEFQRKMVVVIEPESAAQLKTFDEVEVDLLIAEDNVGVGLAEGTWDRIAADAGDAGEAGGHQG